MEQLTFSFMQAHGGDERESLLLARSIRTFGGNSANAPIWIMVPQGKSPFSETTRQALHALDVNLLPFIVPDSVLGFPFGGKVFAAAAAESLLGDRSRLLVWMDSDTVILREPRPFVIPEKIQLGYRPVMLKNISSLYDEPIDRFWKLIFSGCHTTESNIFPMRTTVDEVTIRPQFNAGMMVVRPEKHLLRTWQVNFESLYRHPELQEFYKKHILYKIFIHQAVLSATLLALLNPTEMQELGAQVNIPVFLPAQQPEEIISLRYDEFNFFEKADWIEKVHLQNLSLEWLKEQIHELHIQNA